MRWTKYCVLIVLAVTGAWLVWFLGGEPEQKERDNLAQSDKPNICSDVVFKGVKAVICTVDPAIYEIELVYRDVDNKPYGSVAKAAAELAPVFAMNAGMYHADLKPVGLYVEDEKELTPLNVNNGFGNFFLKPNGVFYLSKSGVAGVMETNAYQAASIAPEFATQSGPMLVVEDNIHPRFLRDGTSKYIRNGVGIRTDGKLVFAITRDPINLWGFASLFKDFAKCPNALFFDGSVSALAWGTHMEIESGRPAGPIVAVFNRADRN